MNYTLICPSLKHIALVKIATTLWNQEDIRDLMSEFYFPFSSYERREEWQKIENNVMEKIPQLSLPESLKDEILGFIKPVGLQILKWKEYHQEINCLSIRLPSELSWTPHGTVDLKKTAEGLIKNDSLDVTRRYKLACTYCLEDDVLELWNKMPENLRKSFYSKADLSMLSRQNSLYPMGNLRQLKELSPQDLLVLYMYNIIGEMIKLVNIFDAERWQEEKRVCSPYQYGFQHGTEIGGNTVATDYFLEKLTFEERERSLVGTVKKAAVNNCSPKVPKYVYRADVLCFLLSQMAGEQQTEVFKSHSYDVLECLLEWPWQSLFMETANRTWEFLNELHYDRLLSEIVDKVKEGYKDYDYRKLFREFWQQSPDAHKRYVIAECASGHLLTRLLWIEDKENVRLILKDATLVENRDIIFSDRGKEICQGLICRDKWDLLQFFIRECISSKDEVMKFKEEFEVGLSWRTPKEEYAKRKDKFFQLLDDYINEYNKRKSVAESDSCPAKRLCNTEF